MHFIKTFSVIVFIAFSTFSAIAQNGIIRGTIFDESHGDPLIGVTVVAEGTALGAITDLDGKFNLSIAPGTYNLRFSFVSYETRIFSNVRVTSGEVTLLDNIMMKPATIGLSEVTVSSERVRNTEGAMMSIKMNSPNLMDGISAVNFRRMGDSDAAASMKRVPGVSVEGGQICLCTGARRPLYKNHS